jgi:hypothetical protein
VAPTLDLTERVFREVWRTFVEDPRTRVGVRRKLWSSQDRLLVLENGSFLHAKTTRTPASLIGEGLDLVVFDEAAKEDAQIWERYLRPCLSDRQGRSLFTTTPEGQNWVYDLWQRGLRDGQLWESFRFGTRHNPIIPAEEIAQARSELSDAAFKQEYEAAFNVFAGRVYDTFDEATHVAPVQFNAKWPLYRGIDFGYRNPFVCLWVQVDPQDRILVLNELYLTTMTTHDAGVALLQAEKDLGLPEPAGSWCDPSSPEGRAALWQVGVRSSARPRPVQFGVEAVRQALKIRADGSSGLVVSPSCPRTIREFNLYRVKKGGEPGEGVGDAPDQPFKQDDHCMDALRYVVAEIAAGRAHQLAVQKLGTGPRRRW